LTLSTLADRARTILRSDAVIYLFGSVVGRMGSLLLVPLYTRALTPEQYGRYGLAMTLVGLLPTLLTWGLIASSTRAYFSEKDVEKGRARAGAVAKGALSLAVLGVVVLSALLHLFFPHGFEGVTRHQLQLALIAALGMAAAALPDGLLRAERKPWRVVALSLVQFLVTTGVGITLVRQLGRGTDGAVEAATASALVGGSLGLAYVVFHLRGTEVVRITREELPIALLFVPHFLGSWLQDVGDRWMLGTFGRPDDLGPFYLAVQLASPALMVMSSYNASVTADLGEAKRAGGLGGLAAAMPGLYKRFFALALVAAAGVGVLGLGLPVLVGPKFLTAALFLPVLLVALVIDAGYYPSANFLYYTRPKYIPLVTFATVVVSLVSCYVLLRRFGVAGVLGARLVTSTFRSAAQLLLVRHIVAHPKLD
jgi:O-antigen/teichoic acid export membrane protein